VAYLPPLYSDTPTLRHVFDRAFRRDFSRACPYSPGMVSMKQIRDWSRSVASQFKPDRIILFGSYAYGKPREDSDVDLLVVLPHDGLAARKASEIRLALPSDVPVDVIVRSPEKIRERLRMNDFFVREITEKGLVLYASGSKRMA